MSFGTKVAEMETIKKRPRPQKTMEDYLVKSTKVASWESRNEGIHERVNFDDTIWGFDLAGGAYYKTPLRVTMVKENSRAANAGIRPGDILQKINDIDTATLQLQEAHDIILQSGIHIRLNVAAPDVEETTYSSYVDEVKEEEDTMKRMLKRQTSKVHKPFKGAKVNEPWSQAWPSFKRRALMYRESNCFLVNSNYATKHPHKIKSVEAVDMKRTFDPTYIEAAHIQI